MHRSFRTILPALSSAAVACAPLVASADFLSPEASQVFTLTPWVAGLGDVTDFRFLPGGRAVIVEKSGTVRVGTPQALVIAATLPVDTESEKGLLGVEVDPAFAVNGFIYLYWSVSDVAGGTDLDRHRVSRFTVGSDDRIDLASERIVVRGLRGPANHDGGALAIGPDGKLYIGVGDSGCNSGQPPGEGISNWFATCLTNGNGKILRVNLDGTIPSDNPLFTAPAVTACGSTCGVEPSPMVTGTPQTEIWVWGLRNPWRMWFDPGTGNLWVGDVGEVTYEEINVVERGRHYGWPLREGAAGQSVSRCADYTPQSGDCVDPVYFCGRQFDGGIDGDCRSINGGRIVDSCTWPLPWRGRYFFGDNANGRMWALPVNAQRNAVAGARVDLGMLTTGRPISFQVGPDGDLYVAAYATPGAILRISPISREVCAEPDGGETVGDAGTGTGPGAGGGTTAVGIGGHPVPSEPPPVGPCGCPSAPAFAGWVALLALARVRRRRAGA
jgi:glucose/arabinose dehydrogenase